LTDGAIGVEEPLLKGIDGGATTEDEIVAELHLRKKQPVLNAGVLFLLGQGACRAKARWPRRNC